jgi:ethanolamine utilization protein EutA
MHEIGFDHLHPSAEDRARLSETISAVDNVDLTTVGIDVGSSTSHLMFSMVHMQRLTEALSSRFVIVGREVIWRSPIMLTPYRPDDTIDAEALKRFFDEAYAQAKLSPEDIDSGAVILTGEALKRRNARAIADLFAAEGGKFVCASAGHNLEAVMAAHGSGAVAFSKSEKNIVLCVDIGGGTTKFALVRNGHVLANAAVAVGGRLVAFDGKGRISRVEEPALGIARQAGVTLELGEKLSDADRERLVATMVEALVACIRQQPQRGLVAELALTPWLPAEPKPDVIAFSGGVAEFIYGRESGDHGDLGRQLADGLVAALQDGKVPYPVYDPGQGIRATVIGASQFSVQVSGNTILVSHPETLPLRNVPVIHLHLHLKGDFAADDVRAEIARALTRFDIAEGDCTVALAFRWEGEPLHARLYRLAEGICKAMPKALKVGQPLILMMDGDVARTLGEILRRELDVESAIVSVDGLQLKEFDYVDIGAVIRPTNVVPLIIKSLLFSAPEAALAVAAGS